MLNEVVTIKKINETDIKVTCTEEYMELDIQSVFSFKVDNTYNRKKGWDGTINLYNRARKTFPYGLLYKLLLLCKKREWKYEIDPALIPSADKITEKEVLEIVRDVIAPCNEKGEPIEPYDYQIKSLMKMLNNDRTIQLAATSAGKSLIIYLYVRILQLTEEFSDKRIMITVPTTMLVEQLFSDFDVYASNDENWSSSMFCQKISSKYPKNFYKQIIITTWQSAQNFPLEVLTEGLGAIIVDECHGASAKVLSNIVKAAVNTPIKHGLTGTLDGCECNETCIEGIFGPPVKIVTAKELIDKGRATPVEIKMVVFVYNPEDSLELSKKLNAIKDKSQRYHAEIEWINAYKKRTDALMTLMQAVKGNKLALFGRNEKFGVPLYERYKELNPDSTFLITGDVDIDERMDIKEAIEKFDESMTFAAVQTFKMGVSIKKLMNLFFLSSWKSKVTILQSIGRLLRLHDQKKKAVVWDVVDCFKLKNGKAANATFRHAEARLEHYRKEGHKVKFLQIQVD